MDPSTHPMHAEWQMDFLGGSKSIELQPVCISLHHMMGNIRSCPSSNLSNLNAVTPFVMSNSGTILLLFWLFEAKADSEPARLFSSCWLPTHVRWFLRARNSGVCSSQINCFAAWAKGRSFSGFAHYPAHRHAHIQV